MTESTRAMWEAPAQSHAHQDQQSIASNCTVSTVRSNPSSFNLALKYADCWFHCISRNRAFDSSQHQAPTSCRSFNLYAMNSFVPAPAWARSCLGQPVWLESAQLPYTHSQDVSDPSHAHCALLTRVFYTTLAPVLLPSCRGW